MTAEPNRPPRAAASPTARSARRWRIAGVGALAALAASAVYNVVAAQRAEAKHPPVGAFIDVDGVRLHYVDRGTGPAVVLLHGNGVMLQDWDASGVLDAAAAGHRVIAFDRPGFGYSDRPRSTVWTPAAQARLIASAVRALGIERVVVVGHSWATLVALAMALDAPELVRGLVLVSGYYYGTARPDVVPFSTPAIPGVGDIMAHTISPLAGAALSPAAVKASFAPAPVDPRFAQVPAGLMLRPSQVRATAADTAMMVPGAIALSRRYAELAVPVIVIAGEGDLIAHADRHAGRVIDDIAGAELRTVPGQGHMLHYAVPERIVAAIGDVAQR